MIIAPAFKFEFEACTRLLGVAADLAVASFSGPGRAPALAVSPLKQGSSIEWHSLTADDVVDFSPRVAAFLDASRTAYHTLKVRIEPLSAPLRHSNGNPLHDEMQLGYPAAIASQISPCRMFTITAPSNWPPFLRE